MIKSPIVFFDIDHTVADTFWRDPMIGGPGGWDAYEAAARHDKPVAQMAALLRALFRSGYENVGLTARPEKSRALTTVQLSQFNVPHKSLLMRPNGDLRRSPEIKLEMAKAYCDGDLSKIAFILEDRSDVSDAFRREGVIVLQCHISARSAISHPGPVSA